MPTCTFFNLFNSDSSKFQEFYAGKNVEPDEFMLVSVSEDFIYKELCKFNPSKSAGTDNIPARFVKDAASVLTKPILHIINLSIEQNSVPNDLKSARVVPLFKKNKRCDVGNYRPVCYRLCLKSWKGLFIHNWKIILRRKNFCLTFSLVFETNSQLTHA